MKFRIIYDGMYKIQQQRILWGWKTIRECHMEATARELLDELVKAVRQSLEPPKVIIEVVV